MSGPGLAARVARVPSRGSLILPGVAGRVAGVGDPPRPCQPGPGARLASAGGGWAAPWAASRDEETSESRPGLTSESRPGLTSESRPGLARSCAARTRAARTRAARTWAQPQGPRPAVSGSSPRSRAASAVCCGPRCAAGALGPAPEGPPQRARVRPAQESRGAGEAGRPGRGDPEKIPGAGGWGGGGGDAHSESLRPTVPGQIGPPCRDRRAAPAARPPPRRGSRSRRPASGHD